ncbi:MAG TPA: META domain-containing protein [Vicinamibacterales bacterium]|nr:META domain-containing protein [Vicinamibacterales bacterium]
MLKTLRQAAGSAMTAAAITFALSLTQSVEARANQSAPDVSAVTPLEGTYWKAIELGGKPVSSSSVREAHLIFKSHGQVSGADGCNRLRGSYELKREAITFGAMVSTRMACTDTGGTDRAFGQVLKRARRLRIVGDHLELSDAAGRQVAVFRAADQPRATTGAR